MMLAIFLGPHEYPIIGNLYHFRIENEHLLEKFWRLSNGYYPIYKLWILIFPLVVLLDPEDVKELLKSNEHIKKAAFYKYLKPWLSYGLLTSSGK
ncbi:cytochrome P450 4C1-like [Polistes fuscatus]|uniref:cytochrome P450 4C1-like n=1 Tax=Polistes fuscatus TaxID=30207 RepID=UPI001CA87556|nr:cytochrome P450 4C1-like [Polistes fuscatus]XP_043502796.1 cytochrome P450 4C1-like [Polistes fuscatus]XP_043502797.1 cytochrome P450 4C1-like [Polistes fuscatus]